VARGDKSEHADVLREVSETQGVPVDELARRAQFMLACFLLPASGTFYEILDVAPDASAQEIREQWAAAIHRYHPDRFGGENPWLNAQARRLLEAYETLRDPARRRLYDDQLGRESRAKALAPSAGFARRRLSRRRSVQRAAIVITGIIVLGVAMVAALRLKPTPLPPAPLPPAPKLLEKWLSAPPPEGLAAGGPVRGKGDAAR
jgi:hypothetical protein